MIDKSLNKIFTKRTIYKYNYQEDVPFNEGDTLDSLKDNTEFRAISINDDYRGEMMNYEIEELEYGHKEDILRDKNQRMGKVTDDISYEYIYDNRFNLVEKKLSRYSVDTGNDIVVYTYENIYDKEGRLIKTLERYYDDRLIATIEFTYCKDQLIKKEFKYKSGYYKTINYYYNEKGILYEKSILKNGELSHYYNYTVLEDGRIKKNLLNPTRGKYKWELTYGYDNKEDCIVDIHEPILTVDIIKEIMGYIIDRYEEIIKCVTINIMGMNLLYKYEDSKIYKHYENKYGICILEFF